jgi:hypothetical protein
MKKETMHSIIPQEEEVSILTVDTEAKDKEEVWVKAEDK